MENRRNLIKLRFSKMFLSSFASCKTKNTSQVTDHQRPIPCTDPPNPNEPLPFISLNPKPKPKPKPPHNHPSILCRPRCPETFDGMIRESNCFLPVNYYHSLPRHRISSSHPLSDDPMRSPVSPLMNHYLKLQASETELVTEKKKKMRRRARMKKKKGDGKYPAMEAHLKKSKKGDALFPMFPWISSSNDEDWFSSDDEREDEGKNAPFSSFSSKSVSFSSKSISNLSSDSDSNPPPTQILNGRWRSGARCKTETPGNWNNNSNVKGSFAVVKRSSDPYSDFRASMVEMIVERHMFGAHELEKLLECFLCLNSHHHHKLIVEVFADILETLFPTK